MFVFDFSLWLARFIFGAFRVVCIIAFLAWPIFFASKAIWAGQSNAFLYSVFAYVWPIFVCVIVFFVLRKINKSPKATSPAYSNAADNLLYGSNQPMYSPQSLVNSELPYTDEHLAKYGSTD